MPVLPRGRPGGRQGGGDRHLRSGGRRARGPRSLRSKPQPPKGKRRVRRRRLSRRRKGPPRRPWRWRSRGRVDSVFSFLFLSTFCLLFLFSLLSRRVMGGRSTGTPHYNRASWFGVGEYFFIKARCCPARGSGTTAAIALRAACSGLQITESKQNKTKKTLGLWNRKSNNPF